MASDGLLLQQPACGHVATAAKPRAASRLWYVKQRKKMSNVLKFNWVTGSPPKFETLLASWYPTYMQSFIISHSSCAEQYGDMSADTQIHTLTIKPPTAGVQLVVHTCIRVYKRHACLCITCLSLCMCACR